MNDISHYLNKPRQVSPFRPQDNLSSIVFSESPTIDYSLKSFEAERKKREIEAYQKQERILQKRESNILKEAGRWQAMDLEYQKNLSKLDLKRSNWKAGQKNNASEAYNVLTLKYDETVQGEALKYRDKARKEREGHRLANLDMRMNSGYNIITGASRTPPLIPRF
jgi:hypothetical protein